MIQILWIVQALTYKYGTLFPGKKSTTAIIDFLSIPGELTLTIFLFLMPSQNITIRKATHCDIPFIEKEAYRLLSFGPPIYRNVASMNRQDIKGLKESLEHPINEVFLALDQEALPLGLIHLTVQQDFHFDTSHAHIADLFVTAAAEGKGVAKLLMHKAEQWALERHFTFITLRVYPQNLHAIEVYKKLGYQLDLLKFIKLIPPVQH